MAETQTNKVSETELAIYNLLKTEKGAVFFDWLKKRTVEKQIGYGVADGVQTAILISRELGRNDIYHEIKNLINKVELYGK
jgi:hypothetical protein